MKHLLTLIILAASVASFAQTRVLTTAEQVALVQSDTFQNECYAAIRAYANYWSVNDGTTFTTEADNIAWAKNRILAVSVITDGINFGSPPEMFVNFFSTHSLEYGESPSISEIVSTLLTATPNRFEQAAAAYFNIWGDDINMSVGGN